MPFALTIFTIAAIAIFAMGGIFVGLYLAPDYLTDPCSNLISGEHTVPCMMYYRVFGFPLLLVVIIVGAMGGIIIGGSTFAGLIYLIAKFVDNLDSRSAI